MTMTATHAKSASAQRGERLYVQVPLSDAERREIRHRAIDAGLRLGEFLRHVLGLPPRATAGVSGAPMR